jgi:hypothetical protein
MYRRPRLSACRYARYAIGVLLDSDGDKICQGLKAGDAQHCVHTPTRNRKLHHHERPNVFSGNYISLSTPHLGVRGCVSLWQTFVGELLFPTSKQMLLQVSKVNAAAAHPSVNLARWFAGHGSSRLAHRPPFAQDDGSHEQVHDRSFSVQDESNG